MSQVTADRYSVVFHQYTESNTGHVNVEFKVNGISQGFYGANTSPEGTFN